MYKENPKLKGSGLLGAVPQTGTCPVGCKDCFFQSGRSFLEPHDLNLPNVPDFRYVNHQIVRMNDMNDSNHNRPKVEGCAMAFKNQVFFNTSIPEELGSFNGPVVLTVNPGEMTDERAHVVEPIPPNLMFVRVRVNTWNIEPVVDPVVKLYTEQECTVVLTFMRYYDQEIPEGHRDYYEFKNHIQNPYWVINYGAWHQIVNRYSGNKFVATCGRYDDFHCRFCGVCLREFFATQERIRPYGTA